MVFTIYPQIFSHELSVEQYTILYRCRWWSQPLYFFLRMLPRQCNHESFVPTIFCAMRYRIWLTLWSCTHLHVLVYLNKLIISYKQNIYIKFPSFWLKPHRFMLWYFIVVCEIPLHFFHELLNAWKLLRIYNSQIYWLVSFSFFLNFMMFVVHT